MWELDYKEGWVSKNWCLQIVVLEKTLESPLTARYNQSILKEISPEYSLEGLMLKLKLQYFWLPDVKNWLIRKDPDAGKDWRQKERGMTEDEMVGWHHWLSGCEFEQAQGKVVKDKEAWYTGVHGMAKSWKWLSNWMTSNNKILWNSLNDGKVKNRKNWSDLKY